jgi:cytoskeleton protein RodZ
MSPPDAEITELPSSPGARLRREREGRGMSQQQAAETLNLDPSILAHIEANDFAALGAPVFVKGHLRRYAAVLGIDVDEILAMYDRSKQHLDEPSLVPKSRLEMAPVRGKSRWPWVVGGAVTFLLASALIAYLSENGLPWVEPASDETVAEVFDATPATPPASGNSPDAPGALTETTRPATDSAPPSPVADAAAGAGMSTTASTASPAAAAPQPGNVNLQLRFTADSWVEVFDGSGKAVLYDLGKAGSERTLTAAAPLSVTLGDARGVTVTVNGRVLPPPPRAAGETLARFSIGADGSLR